MQVVGVGWHEPSEQRQGAASEQMRSLVHVSRQMPSGQGLRPGMHSGAHA